MRSDRTTTCAAGRPSSTAAWPTLVALGVVLAALLVPAAPAGAASGGLAWSRVYDDPGHGNDAYSASVRAPGGGVYVAGDANGPTTVAYVARYSAAGRRLWRRTYSDPPVVGDELLGATSDARGDLIAVGTTHNGAGVLVLKYGPGGQRKWARVYDDPLTPGDQSSLVAADAAGDVYVGVTSTNASLVQNLALVKYSPSGKRRWVRRYAGGSLGFQPTEITLDRAGEVYVTGNDAAGPGAVDITTLKYGPTGRRLWLRTWNGPGNGNDGAFGIAVGRTGDTYVAGTTGNTMGGYDAVLLRYGPRGALKWHRIRESGGTATFNYFDVALESNGDPVAVGAAAAGAVVVRLSPAGTTRWTQAFDGLPNNPQWLAIGPAGAVYVTGAGYNNVTSYDVVTAKISASGAARWTKVYDAAGAFDPQNAASITTDRTGVYVAGFQEAASIDAVLLRYRP